MARALPFFRYIRTPGRVYVVIALLLAILAAWGIDTLSDSRLRWVVASVAIVAIVATAPPDRYGDNPLPVKLAAVPARATLLHLPPFLPGDSHSSNYSFSITQRPTPIPNGYTPFAPSSLVRETSRLGGLTLLPPDRCQWSVLTDRYRVDYVAVHVNLVDQTRSDWQSSGEQLVTALAHAPWLAQVENVTGVVVFRVDRTKVSCP
jgi:hypothetical protein